MNTMLMTVKSRSILPSCWLYEDKQYQIEGKIKYELRLEFRKLPWAEIEDEGLLQELGISYRKVVTQYSEYLEYWDKDLYETEEICLPLYVKVIDEYKYAGKSYTRSVLTEATAERAFELEKTVMNKIAEQKAEREAKMLHDVWYEYAEEALGSDIYKIVEPAGTNFPYRIAALTTDSLDLKKADNRFKVLVTRDSRNRKVSCYGIFDMGKIANDVYLKLLVPKNIAGYIIGKGGCNIEQWKKELGVKKITVVGV